MSQHGYPPRGDWRAQRPWRPVWHDLDDLLEVLATYRSWYAQGLDDKEISRRIAMRYVLPNNPQVAQRMKR